MRNVQNDFIKRVLGIRDSLTETKGINKTATAIFFMFDVYRPYADVKKDLVTFHTKYNNLDIYPTETVNLAREILSLCNQLDDQELFKAASLLPETYKDCSMAEALKDMEDKHAVAKEEFTNARRGKNFSAAYSKLIEVGMGLAGLQRLDIRKYLQTRLAMVTSYIDRSFEPKKENIIFELGGLCMVVGKEDSTYEDIKKALICFKAFCLDGNASVPAMELLTPIYTFLGTEELKEAEEYLQMAKADKTEITVKDVEMALANLYDQIVVLRAQGIKGVIPSEVIYDGLKVKMINLKATTLHLE